VILDIDGGTGRQRENELGAVAARVRTAGVPVLGYLDTAYGHRDLDLIAAEAGRYRQWYGVDGFFLDQAASGAGQLGYYRAVTELARAHAPGEVVLNHGTYPDRRYADLADALVTFEGPWSEYARAHAPAWALRRPADQFWHLIYAAPATVLDAVLGQAERCNAATVYVTDRDGANPWDGLPGYFERQLVLAGERRDR